MWKETPDPPVRVAGSVTHNERHCLTLIEREERLGGTARRRLGMASSASPPPQRKGEKNFGLAPKIINWGVW